MYDIKWIREHPDAFDRGLKRRGHAPLSAALIKLDETRRALITKLEQAQARRNAASKEIGQAKAKKDETAASKLMAELAASRPKRWRKFGSLEYCSARTLIATGISRRGCVER